MDPLLDALNQPVNVGDYVIAAIGAQQVSLYVVIGETRKMDSNYDGLELKTVGIRHSENRHFLAVYTRCYSRKDARWGLVKINTPIHDTVLFQWVRDNYPSMTQSYFDKYETIKKDALKGWNQV